MPRYEPERFAKRAERLVQTLDKLHAKGRFSDPKYRKLIGELAGICDQILDAREKAQADLQRTLMDAENSRKRRKLAEEKLKAEREAFIKEMTECRDSMERGQADLKRQLTEIRNERNLLAEKQAETELAKHRCNEFMKQMQGAAASL